MSETKWTRGPWRLLGRYDEKPIEWEAMQVVCRDVGDDGNMEVVAEWTGFVDEEQLDATAHLISAAPELYEALMVQQSIGDRLARGQQVPKDEIKAAVKKQAAAIAKARGEAL